MPFFDDSGPRIEEQHSPLERSFALVRDQLERMVALNILWAVQSAPLLIAWAFPAPDLVRVLFTLYTALAIPPATAILFAILAHVSSGESVDRHLLLECVQSHLKVGLLKLMPLYSLFFWLIVVMNFAADQGWAVLDVLAQLLILLLLTISLYWGPLIAAHPEWSLWQIGSGAVRLFWDHPGHTLLLGVVCAVALFFGIISIAGFVLIVPVLIMLFQTEFARAVLENRRQPVS